MTGNHTPDHQRLDYTHKWRPGLRVPKEDSACYIDVQDTRHNWEEGKLFVFDDTYNHEVFNHSKQARIILLLHVKRPLEFPGSWAQNLFFWGIQRSPFVQDAKCNFETQINSSGQRMPQLR